MINLEYLLGSKKPIIHSLNSCKIIFNKLQYGDIFNLRDYL